MPTMEALVSVRARCFGGSGVFFLFAGRVFFFGGGGFSGVSVLCVFGTVVFGSFFSA
jgi:hypothetical protein